MIADLATGLFIWISAAAIALTVLTGCSKSIEGQAVPQPVKLDCDLIFPGPGSR
jgi:hypothetical protein